MEMGSFWIEAHRFDLKPGPGPRRSVPFLPLLLPIYFRKENHAEGLPLPAHEDYPATCAGDW